MQPSCLDMDGSILAEILDAAMEIGEADCGDIRLVNGRTGILDFVVQRGFSGEWERYWRSKPLKFSICEMALDRKQPILIKDIGNSPFFKTIPSLRRTQELGCNSLRTTPLLSRSGGRLGTVALFKKQPQDPDDRSLRLLDLFARQAADRIENVCSTRKLSENEERQAFLLKVADTLAPLKDHLAVEREACRMLGEYLNVGRTYFVHFDEEDDTALIQEDYAQESNASLRGTYTISEFKWAIEKLRRNECNIVPDMKDMASVPEAHQKACLKLGILSSASVPLLHAGKLVAALCLAHHQQRAWLENEITLLRDVASRIWEVLQRIKSEKALELANETRERAQRLEALGQLTGGITHDFNNLLMVLSVNLEIAEMQMTAERGKIAIARAVDAIKQGASLNRRLLTFSRHRPLKTEAININERIVSSMELLRRAIGEEIHITTNLAEDSWIACIDSGEFDNALMNLAMNARDAMEAGGRISIETRNVFLHGEKAGVLNLPEGPYISLGVRDTGNGMSPEVIQRAIEPFFTTKSVGKASGLGLSSIYGFVRQSGGALDIKSRLGTGTIVSLYLPKSTEVKAVPKSNDRDTRFLTGQGEMLLLVEDHEQVLEATSERLRMLGYNVLVARSGRAGIKALELNSLIRLVVSDIVMPGGVSGYDLAEWAKKNRPDVHVILVSGNLGAGASLSQQNSYRILLKPYSFTVLAKALRDVLEAPESAA